MSSIHSWGLSLCATAILAASSARAEGPDTVPAEEPAALTASYPQRLRDGDADAPAQSDAPDDGRVKRAPRIVISRTRLSGSPSTAPVAEESATTSRARPRAKPIRREWSTLDVDVRQVQVRPSPPNPNPSLPAVGPSTGPRARIVPPSATAPPPAAPSTTPPPPPPPPPSATAAAPAPAPAAESPADESFARAPGTDLANEGAGSGAAGIGFNYAPIMLGDQAPASLHVLAITMPPVPKPPVPGQPPSPPIPGRGQVRGRTAFVPWARGFKVADNQSPMPQDRIFYTFDYFNNLNGDINRRLNSSINSFQAYRELLGIEKTFLDGNASIGIRVPINTLSTNSSVPALGGTSTAVGNMTIFSKYVLWSDPTKGNLLSAGLAVTTPNGPTSFAGSPAAFGFHDAQIQPFLGYILRKDRFYIQGFTAIDIPTDPNDVLMWYNDVAVGYFAYRSPDPNALLSAIVPTFEVHISDPLDHRGALRPNDPAGTPDVVDLTMGSSFVLRKRVIASFCCVVPVTGPRPFDVEAMALLNVYFGRFGIAQATSPPVGGQ